MGEVPTGGGVVEEFARLVARHQLLHQLLREERQLREGGGAPGRCRLALSDAQLQDEEVTAAGELQQLLLQLQEENGSPDAYDAPLRSIEALAALHRPTAVEASRLTAAPGGEARRPLLALPLWLLGRLAAAGVVTWSAVVSCLSSQPGLMKTHLLEVMTAITAPPDGGSPCASDGAAPTTGVVAASQLCLALVAAAFCSSAPSRTQNFAKKVLQVLSFKIVKFLLNVSARVHAPVSSAFGVSDASAAAAPASVSSASAVPASAAAVTADATTAEKPWERCALVQFYDLLLEGGEQVGQRCVAEFFTFHLRLAVTCDPTVQLSYVIQNQHLYRTSSLHPLLRAVLSRVCAGVGWEAALQLLDATLRHQEVSWGLVLPLLGTLVSISPPAALRIQELVQEYLREGCCSEDAELCVLGLVVARQCCEEAPPARFPRYPHWFTATFASAAASPAPTARQFTFLMKVLSDLVPHERPLHLRTHTTQGMATPRGCQGVLRDYQMLARTRLRDLECLSSSLQAQQEAQAAVHQFAQSRQLPRAVLDMAVFRRAHFLSVFLPALLARRDENGYGELVEALSASGHLTPSVLARAAGASGTTASLPCTPASDLEDLRQLLQRLPAGPEDPTPAAGGGADAVQRTLSDAAAAVEKLLQADDAAFAHDTALSAQELRHFNKPRALQVLGVVLECVARVVGAKDTVHETSSCRPPAWLPQLVAVLAVSPTLQGALVAHALGLVDEDKHRIGPPSAAECGVLGAVLCEVSALDGLFMNVRCDSNVSADASSPSVALHTHLLRCIAPSSPSASWAAARLLSGWLSWRALCSGTSSEDKEPCSSADDVSSVYWCVLWRLEEAKHLLQSSFCVSGLATARAIARPNLAVWLQFEMRCGGERSHASRSRSLLRLINQHFPASDGRAVVTAALSVLIDTPLMEQEDRLCLLSLLQQLAGRVNTPEGLLTCYSNAIRKSPLHHENFVRLLQDVPPGVVVGGVSGSEVMEMLVPLVQEMRSKSPSVHLSSEVTCSLINALLLVRCAPLIADSSLDELWYSVAFHWAAVRWVFDENRRAADEVAFPSLQEMWRELKPLPIGNGEGGAGDSDRLTELGVARLRPQLAVPYLLGASLQRLRQHSNPTSKLPVHLFTGLLRKMYIKLLASFIGEQIFHRHLSFFSDQERNASTVLAFHERLLKHGVEMFREEMKEDIGYFLDCISSTVPDDTVESYCLFGFVRVCLGCFESEDSSNMDDLLKHRILHVLISCHGVFSEYFENYESLQETTAGEPPSKKLKLDTDSTADYPLQLSQQIVHHVRTTGPSCLRLLLPVLSPTVDDAVKNLIDKICSQPSGR